MDTLLKDIRYALRWMARSPGFSAVAILSLGLGVGVNTAMFSLVDSLLFRPLPVTEPSSLVDVFTTGGDGDEFATSSYADFQDLKAQNTVFTEMMGYSPMMAPLSLGDRSRMALGQVVTSNHFTMLGIQPFLGRLLVPADDDPSAAHVVVISHRMWLGRPGVAHLAFHLQLQPGRDADRQPHLHRGAARRDHRKRLGVAVINETMARKYWPNESPVGHTFQVVSSKRTHRIVGVVADHKRHGVLEQPTPFVYYASAQRPARYNFLLARTSGDATALLGEIRRELLAMEPGLVFMASNTMEQNLGLSLMPARVGALLATAFGGLGTLLAAIGLYGVIAFSVARRTREIGVRMALGARPERVMGMVMQQGFTVVAIGLVAGGVLAAVVAFALRGVLYGVQPLDPVAWGLAFTAMIMAAGLANFVPARRAMRIDPMTALRTD